MGKLTDIYEKALPVLAKVMPTNPVVQGLNAFNNGVNIGAQAVTRPPTAPPTAVQSGTKTSTPQAYIPPASAMPAIPSLPKPAPAKVPVVTRPPTTPAPVSTPKPTAPAPNPFPSSTSGGGQSQVVNNATGGQNTLTTNPDGTQTSTPVPFTPAANQGDTFENRNNPNSAWVYYGNGEWRNDKTGETKNTAPTPAAPAASQNDYLAKWGISPEEIEKNLQAEKTAIQNKYRIQREEAAKKTENERKANLSGYYSVGEVNPLSSGVGSVDDLAERNLASRNDALSNLEAQEIADATNRAYGRKAEGAAAERQAQIDNDARIQQEYTNTRQKMLDDATLAENKQQMNQKDKDASWDRVSTMMSNFGSTAFDNMDETTLRNLEMSAGMPKGSLAKGVKTLKELELGGQLNIQKGVDGAVYNLSVDKNGNIKKDLIIPGKAVSAGSYTYIDPETGEVSVVNGDRELTAAQAKLLAEGNNLGNVLQPLYDIVNNKQSLFGPIRGFIQGANPYATETQTIEDDLRRAAQTIGKYMEGGVLRKEDEIKYQRMLPKITDTPAVAKNKLDGIAQMVLQQQQEYIGAYAKAGYNVKQFVGGNEIEGSSQDIRSVYESAGFDESYDEIVAKYGEETVRQILQEQGFISP